MFTSFWRSSATSLSFPGPFTRYKNMQITFRTKTCANYVWPCWSQGKSRIGGSEVRKGSTLLRNRPERWQLAVRGFARSCRTSWRRQSDRLIYSLLDIQTEEQLPGTRFAWGGGIGVSLRLAVVCAEWERRCYEWVDDVDEVRVLTKSWDGWGVVSTNCLHIYILANFMTH